MSYTSAAVLTLNGVDYNPISFDYGADNDWSPTTKLTAVLARPDIVAPTNLSARTNMITNPSASVDLTGAVAGSAALVRQANIVVFRSAHRTAFRLNCSGSASQFTLGGDYGGLRLGVQQGKTYTVSGTFYIDDLLTGAENAQSRQIAVGCIAPSLNGGTSFYLATSPKAPNTVKTPTRVSVTFTVPADATSIVFRFFAGHAAGFAYWTDLMLVEGNGTETDGTPIPFFDGDNVDTSLYNYDWAGAAGLSPSTRTVAFVSPESSPVVDPRGDPYPTARLRYWFGDSAAPDLIFDVTLLVRTYVIDDVEDTVTLTLMSHEILLQDYKNAEATDWAPGPMTLRDMVTFAMRKIGITAYTLDGIPVVTIPATATVWRSGQSLDDWLRGAMRSQGVEIMWSAVYAPQFRAYLTSNPTKGATFGVMNAIWGRNLLSSRFGVDADSDAYGDAAIAAFQWTDAAGASQRKSYSSVPAGPYRRVKVVNFETADPGFNAADSVRAISSRSGFTQQVTMLPSVGYSGTDPRMIDLGFSLRIQRRDGTVVTAIIARYEVSYPADTMTVGLIYVSAPSPGPVSPLPMPQP